MNWWCHLIRHVWKHIRWHFICAFVLNIHTDMTINWYFDLGGGHLWFSHATGVTGKIQLGTISYIWNQLVHPKHHIHKIWCFYHKSHNLAYMWYISSSFLSFHQETYVCQIVPSQCLAQPMAMPLAGLGESRLCPSWGRPVGVAWSAWCHSHTFLVRWKIPTLT